MDRLIPKLYGDYADYVNHKKMVPNSTDGLLPVQRRVLLTAHLMAKKKYIKTIKVLGECAAKFHPYSLAEGTAEWGVLNKVLDGSGQWGAVQQIRKINAAAPRYTSVRANAFIEELAFKFVDFVPWEEDEMDKEPVKIPTMIPICLFLQYELSMIAFGFKPVIPTYNISDLVKRLLFLLGKGPEVIIKPRIKGCKTLTGNKTCKILLETGSARIDVQGIHQIDEQNMCIYVKGWSPSISFETLFDRIDKYNGWGLASNGDIGYVDMTGDNTEDDLDIYVEEDPLIKFEVLKLRNRPEIFQKMKEAITEKLKATHTYHNIVNHDGKVCEYPIDKMLLNAYEFYKSALRNFLEHSIEKTSDQIRELTNIIKIRPHISTSSEQFRDNIEGAYVDISEKSGVPVDEVKGVVEKYRIKKLLSVNVDCSDLESQLTNFTNGLNNLETVCVNGYVNLGESLK